MVAMFNLKFYIMFDPETIKAINSLKIQEIDFKFGVRDFEKTNENHLKYTKQYNVACSSGDIPFFTWDGNCTLHASAILKDTKGFITKRKSTVKMQVNCHFRNSIIDYLKCYNVDEKWNTAVYLSVYGALNAYMNRVANLIWLSL